MSLPNLAQKVEENKRARYFLAIGCIVLGLGGFVSSVNERRQATSQMLSLVSDTKVLVTNTNGLVQETNADVANTNSLVSAVGILVPQINSLNARTAVLDKEIEGSKGGSPRLTAALRAEEATVQAQADAASRQLLVSMVPGIFYQLGALERNWQAEDEHAVGLTIPGAERETRRSALTKKYSHQARPLMVIADNLRRQLLQELPPSDQTPEDKNEAVLFAKVVAGGAFQPRDLIEAANYFSALSQRVAAIAP